MTNWKITKQNDIDNIIDLYKNGFSCVQIGKQYNVTGNTISSLLKRNGINVINRQNIISFSKEDVIKDYCDLGLSVSQIARNRNSSGVLISKLLKSANIEVTNKHNLPKFNEHIFDSIDTEEKAYWLGFIFADGYISSRDYGFELSLSGIDVDHLYKFNKFMEYKGDNVKVSTTRCNNKEYKRCRWSIGNKHLWNTLNNYGCTPKKSLSLQFPDKSIFKEEWLIIPFIRGYFDGDGCVSLVHNEIPGKVLTASILGTKEMLSPIKELFFDNNLIKNHDNNDITFSYRLSQKQAYTFLSIIYYNASIYLNRKLDKFKEWKNCRPRVKALGLLEGKIGEGWDANPELTYYYNK